jgi:hypothetical protein
MSKVDRDKFKQNLQTYKEEKANTNQYFLEPDQWVLKKNKDKEGFANIRFLPLKNDIQGIPWVRVEEYNIDLPNGKKFKEYSPTTIGKVSPLLEFQNNLWKIDREAAKALYPKTSYRHSILILDDPTEENIGKIKKFFYYKGIQDIIESAIYPPEGSRRKELIYFCPDEGADFEVNCKPQGQTSSYKTSKFLAPSKITKETHHMGWSEIEKKLFSFEDLFDYTLIKSSEEIVERYLELKNSKPSDEKKEKDAKTKEATKKSPKDEEKEEYDEDEEMLRGVLEDD